MTASAEPAPPNSQRTLSTSQSESRRRCVLAKRRGDCSSKIKPTNRRGHGTWSQSVCRVRRKGVTHSTLPEILRWAVQSILPARCQDGRHLQSHALFVYFYLPYCTRGGCHGALGSTSCRFSWDSIARSMAVACYGLALCTIGMQAVRLISYFSHYQLTRRTSLLRITSLRSYSLAAKLRLLMSIPSLFMPVPSKS